MANDVRSTGGEGAPFPANPAAAVVAPGSGAEAPGPVSELAHWNCTLYQDDPAAAAPEAAWDN